MRYGKRLNNKKGFTLAEVLIVVAILIVLGGVAAIAANEILKNSRQTTADKAAESIAQVFQARIEEIYAFEQENYETLEGSGGSGDLWAIDSGGSGDARMEILSNEGQAIAGDFYGNGIAVKYDPKSCHIISVIYTSDNEKYAIDGIGEGSMGNRKELYKGYVGYYETSVLGALSKFDPNEYVAVRVGHFLNGERQLYNYDELIAYTEIKFNKKTDADAQSKLEGRTIKIDVAITGEESKNTVIYSRYGDFGSYEGGLKIPIVLDSLKANKRFNDQFCTGTAAIADFLPIDGSPITLSQDSGGTSGGIGTYPLIPGENVTVKVSVSSYVTKTFTDTLDITKNTVGTEALLSATSSATDNSLFAYDNGLPGDKNKKTFKADGDTYVLASAGQNTGYIAYIAYGRHLQNLDKTSGIEEGIAKFNTAKINAIQVKDIDFAKKIEGDPAASETAPEKKVCYWFSYYAGKNFTPITNDKIQTFTGKHEDEPEATQKHKISNLTINEVNIANSAIEGRTAAKENVGLFDTFKGIAGSSITDVIIEKPDIIAPAGGAEGTGNAAVLVGKFDGTPTSFIQNVEITGSKVTRTASGAGNTAIVAGSFAGKNIDGLNIDKKDDQITEIKVDSNDTGNVGVIAGEFNGVSIGAATDPATATGTNVKVFTVDNVKITAAVNGTGNVGGLVGKFTKANTGLGDKSGIMKARIATKAGSSLIIDATGTGAGSVGGVVGEFSGDEISEINIVQAEAGAAAATGNAFEITGTTNPDSIVGGIAGTIKGINSGNTTVKTIYVMKPQLKTENNDTVGGAVGKIFKENIGTVTIDGVEITDPLIKASYIAKVGGLVGYSEPQLTVTKSNVQVTATDANNTWENATVGIMTKPQ